MFLGCQQFPTPTPGERPRDPALDVARAVAVVVMIVGHTLDAVLSPQVRAEPLLRMYWFARGFTAPLFLIVSGWALAVATEHCRAPGRALLRARLPRAMLLLTLGYGLRWPGWGIEQLRQGDVAVWGHLLAFDALHAIAVSLLASSLILAVPVGTTWKAGALALLTLLSVALGAVPPPEAPALPPPVAALALAQAVGGTSPFPLLPWAGYFLAGAAVGLLRSHRPLATGLGGAALVALGSWGGIEGMSPGDPRLFALRAGAVLLFFFALRFLPAGIGAAARPIARASLPAYVIHLVVVYGWSTREGLLQRIGPALDLGAALGLALVVCLSTLVATAAVLPRVVRALLSAGNLARRA